VPLSSMHYAGEAADKTVEELGASPCFAAAYSFLLK
jgi:hypothetical protein